MYKLSRGTLLCTPRIYFTSGSKRCCLSELCTDRKMTESIVAVTTFHFTRCSTICSDQLTEQSTSTDTTVNKKIIANNSALDDNLIPAESKGITLTTDAYPDQYTGSASELFLSRISTQSDWPIKPVSCADLMLACGESGGSGESVAVHVVTEYTPSIWYIDWSPALLWWVNNIMCITTL